MPIDPEVEPLLEAGSLPYCEMPVAEARQLMAAGAVALNANAGEFPLAEVSDVAAQLPGRSIDVRVYQSPKSDGAALVYFHGGGWVIGSVATHDAYCRALAATSDVAVVSVDYRLAPEHPFPAAANDAIDITRWVLHGGIRNVDAQRVGVGGDSAGGNLAAVACQQLRAEELAIACQVLIYPIVDCDNETISYQENAEGYVLTKANMDWFWDNYCPDASQRLDPQASPLRNRDLRGLPSALVLTAEFDPLRDEGEQYARRLADSGADVELKRYDGMIHGFVRRLRELKAARRALAQVSEFMRRKLRDQ